MSFERIPAELRERPAWVVWCWGEVDPKTGKRKKPPFSVHAPNGPQHASSTNASTWGTFEQAVAAVEAGKADGIGFAMAAPYVFLDLDEELSEADRFAIASALRSYTEESVSGSGLHVIAKAHLNGGRHPAGFGVFQEGRFCYCSGKHVHGTPWEIHERQDELDAVLDEYLPKPQEVAAVAATAHPVDLNDEELVAFIRDKYPDLWAGRWEQHYESQSEADLALCNRLAWVTGNDAARIDRLFRSCALYREEGDGPDYAKSNGYLARTIKTAIAGASSEGSGQQPISETESVASEVTQASETPEYPESLLEVGDPKRLTDSLTQPIRVSEPESPTSWVSGTDSAPESVTTPERPFALPISEFVALERPNVAPLLADVDGRPVVGRESLTLAGALGGHGKTTLFVDLALHLAAGVDYPPFTVPKPVSILLIENEGSEALFADKLAARLASFEPELEARLDVCTFDWGGFSLADDVHRERLTREIAEKGYDLVFGDPLDSLGIEGVGSPEDTRKFLDLMKQTGLHRSVAWWLNTHPRKDATKEALNEISGAWGGRPDSVLLLRMLENDKTQVRFPKLRWAKRGTRPPILLAFDPDTEAFTYLGEQVEEERDYRAEVNALLAAKADLPAKKKWLTPKEIAAPKDRGGVGANIDTVKATLEQNPEVFESRTGDAAKEVGRSKQATVWQLLQPKDDDDKQPEEPVEVGKPRKRQELDHLEELFAPVRTELEERGT